MRFFHFSSRSHRKRRGGVALVEFALVVSLLILVVFGIIDFSVYGSNSLRLSNAAREGARAAAVGKTVEDIKSRVTRFASPLKLTSADGGNIELKSSSDGGATYDTTLSNNTAGTGNSATADQYVRVTVTATNKSATGALGILFNRTISSQVVMRREG
ncbi:MAG TPA: TadE/TadG family type IV pilus assembly protein [Abditibacterium sp.]